VLRFPGTKGRWALVVAEIGHICLSCIASRRVASHRGLVDVEVRTLWPQIRLARYSLSMRVVVYVS
jgi:hypothetical protein